MPSNCEYFLYQLYIRYGNNGEFYPVYPQQYAISGDTGQDPVIKRCDSPNCGFYDPIFRWHQEDISEAYICFGGNKYYEEIYQVSYDNGFNWENVVPEQTRQGSLYESGSSDCIEYRWVNMDISTDWICDECPELKLKATYSDTTTYEVPCNSSTTLSRAEVTGHSTPYSAMTTAIVGDCVTSIGFGAFNTNFKSSSLTSVTVPSGVTSIGSDAFRGCYGLKRFNSNVDGVFNLPDVVTEIGGSAFEQCSGITSINIPSGVTIINNSTFDRCSSLTSVTVPSGVTSIGSWGFGYCTSLTSCTFEQNSQLTSIGNNAFASCGGLTNINVPSGVTSIGEFAFQGCSVTSMDLPSAVLIGNYAFNACRSLTSVTIGSDITSIGEWAFLDCYSLTSVTVEATTPPTLGNFAFYDTNNCPIYVPAASVNTYKSASGWSDYASRIQAIPT